MASSSNSSSSRGGGDDGGRGWGGGFVTVAIRLGVPRPPLSVQQQQHRQLLQAYTGRMVNLLGSKDSAATDTAAAAPTAAIDNRETCRMDGGTDEGRDVRTD